MWEIDNTLQVLGFLYSVGLGLFYCLVYDIIRALRAEIKATAALVFAQDIVYSLFCAVTCFCFLLSVTGGETRVFVFAGIAAGFVISRFTVSRITFIVFSKAIRLLCFVYGKIKTLSERFFAVCDALFVFLSEKIKKILNFLKNCLKKA